MLHVENLKSARSGREVPNQFHIKDTEKRLDTFQSYDSMIVCVDWENETISFGEDWDYSVTTAKYRNQFMRNINVPGLSSREAIKNAIHEGKYHGFSVALV